MNILYLLIQPTINKIKHSKAGYDAPIDAVLTFLHSVTPKLPQSGQNEQASCLTITGDPAKFQVDSSKTY